MFFSNKSFLSQQDFETRTIFCSTSFETGLDEKKTSRKRYCNDFVRPFIPKSGEAEISPKQQKTIAKEFSSGFRAGNGVRMSGPES